MSYTKKTEITSNQYTGAGFIFYRNKHFLTGFSNHLQKWSGFGGKREPEDKSPLHTAIRELLEELYGIKPSDMIIKWIQNIKIKTIYNRYNYIMYVCDVNELKWISAILMFFGEKSPYYIHLPTDMTELLTERICTTPEVAEVAEVAEVEKIDFMNESTIMELSLADHHFLKDIRIILGNST